jgi:DNA-binding XRE family transcriptional regulator
MSVTMDTAPEAVMFEAYDPAGLGQAIRGLRTSRGWTQQALADWCGVARQTIIALEHGGPVSLVVAMRAVSLLGGKIIVAGKDVVLDADGARR